MLVSLVVSLPVSCLIIKVIYRAMMMDYNGWLTLYFAPWIWPTMLVIGLACYLLVYFLPDKANKQNSLGRSSQKRRIAGKAKTAPDRCF